MSEDSIKIKKLQIQNFKVYKSQSFDFENKSLIVLDGPNGFGKTTMFDAIELLLTGRIRRYDDIKAKLIDRRETRSENPFYCTEGDGSPIEIKAIIEYQNNSFVLARKSPTKEDMGSEINFNVFSLHMLESLDDPITENNKVIEEKLTEFIGSHYKNDFEFLHYIEQEDSLYLLKKSEKDKKESIGYLFNTTSFIERIRKFKQIESIVSQYHTNITNETSRLKDEIKTIKDSLLIENESNYVSLFPDEEFDWDEEEIKFDEDTFNRLLSIEYGLIPKIESLIKNRDTFLQERINEKVDELLIDKDSLESFFYYQFFISNIEELEKEKRIFDYCKNIKEKLNEFDVEELEIGVYDVPDYFSSPINDSTFVTDYENSLKSLKTINKQSDSTTKVLSKLVNTRENLVKHQLEYHDKINDDGVCQLCGYDWHTKELLIQNIDKQTESLGAFNKELSSNLLAELEQFKLEIFPKYLDSIEKIKSTYLYDPNYFEDDFFTKNIIREVTITSLLLTDIKIDYQEFISKEKMKKTPENYTKFIEIITNKKKEIDPEFVKTSFDDVFITYFKEDEDKLNQIDIDLIKKKKKYIKWQYSIFQNTMIKIKNILIEKASSKLEILEGNRDKCRKIIDVQNDSLKNYNAKIINDIELLFHIYSGRIVQDFQGGLGLFIINKNDKIKFVTSPEKTYDAIFSMSNGQLSALVIAFTLALNKKYSTTNLLLVDDPVQSMDDMNTSGFVEVLRNDFSDRQIFITTHEITMSTYIRYKFKKFNISSKRFDVSALPS